MKSSDIRCPYCQGQNLTPTQPVSVVALPIEKNATEFDGIPLKIARCRDCQGVLWFAVIEESPE